METGEDDPRYYAISEVGDLTGLEPHVLRFWQGEFKELKPQKNDAGRRIYTKEDIAVVRRIKELLRQEKYTIEGARQVLAQGGIHQEKDQDLREELSELRCFLTNLLEEL